MEKSSRLMAGVIKLDGKVIEVDGRSHQRVSGRPRRPGPGTRHPAADTTSPRSPHPARPSLRYDRLYTDAEAETAAEAQTAGQAEEDGRPGHPGHFGADPFSVA